MNFRFEHAQEDLVAAVGTVAIPVQMHRLELCSSIISLVVQLSLKRFSTQFHHHRRYTEPPCENPMEAPGCCKLASRDTVRNAGGPF